MRTGGAEEFCTEKETGGAEELRLEKETSGAEELCPEKETGGAEELCLEEKSGREARTMTREIAIEMSGLTKQYGEKTAVDHLDLTIFSGEIFGLLGPNGAGKTTTTLMLTGLTEPTEGTALIGGLDCVRDTMRVKKTVGYMPDNVGFYGDMTGRENLKFTAALNGLDEKTAERRIDDLLLRTGLAEAGDKRVGTYSRGMRQRLGVADVLMKDPQVIIMDEPTLGIDPEGMRELLILIRDLAKKENRTILISSHQLYQIQQICDRVGLFVSGRLVACGTVEELAEQTREDSRFLTEVCAKPSDDRLTELFRTLDGVYSVGREGNRYMIGSEQDISNALASLVVNNGYSLVSLRPCGNSLDEIYRRYFEKAGHEDGSSSGKVKRFISRNR